jgi:hypothetical protein
MDPMLEEYLGKELEEGNICLGETVKGIQRRE